MCIQQPLDKLNENAAAFSETVLVVRGRLVEAAIIMENCDIAHVYPAKMRSFWPQTYAESGEPDNNRQNRKAHYRPNAKAIMRAEDVMCNFLPLIAVDDERSLTTAWASCVALPKKFGSFTNYCKHRGLIKRTAERHLNTIMQQLTTALLAKYPTIANPDWVLVPTLTKAHARTTLIKSHTYWRANDACPKNLPELHEHSRPQT